METEYLDKKIDHSLKLVCMTLQEDYVFYITITDLNEVQCERQVCWQATDSIFS